MNITRPSMLSYAMGIAVTATCVVGAAGQASAAPTPLTIVASGGTSQPNGDGSLPAVDVVYPASTRPTPASGTFAMRSYDDSFPAAEHCEPATAVVEITGDHKTSMTLVATGKVCGQWAADETRPPTQDFVGRYTVVDGPARFVGDDGFVNIVVGDGWSYLFAIDT